MWAQRTTQLTSAAEMGALKRKSYGEEGYQIESDDQPTLKRQPHQTVKRKQK